LNGTTKPAIYLALLHYPVYNKNREVVATAVTNIDVHDIVRSSRTYGVDGVYIVTPIEQQRGLVSEILSHWTEGSGAKHNPARAEAFTLARVVATLEDAVQDIVKREGAQPVSLATSAKRLDDTTSFTACRKAWQEGEKRPQLLLFGTGWGMTEEVTEGVDVRLPPVVPAAWAVGDKVEYNHLSVRSAVATILDRLLGEREEWKE
jgi:hypothetical protein